MRRANVDCLGATCEQRIGSSAERATSVDHVVVDDADLARNIADERGDLGLVVARTILVHDGDVAVEHRLELLGSLGAANVR